MNLRKNSDKVEVVSSRVHAVRSNDADILIRGQWRSQHKNLGRGKKFGGKNIWFETNNTILCGKTPPKAQNDYMF